MTADLPLRVGIVQRVLMRYRVPVFDTLAPRCQGGLSVFAGEEDPGEMANTADRLEVAQLERAANRRLGGGLLAVYWQAGLVNWLEEWDPDVLVVEANPRLASTRSAARWMHRRGRPVLGWGWGLLTQRTDLQRLRAMRRRRFLRRFDGMIAYSSRAAEEYRELGFQPDRVVVCRNAVASRPQAPPPRPAGFDGPPVVLAVGRLVEAKRLDALIRACALLAGTEPALTPELRIVGRGQATARLEALAAVVYPQTRFLGPLYGPELEREFARADLFALPGQAGLAVQEAMAHGLPVVVGEGDHTQDDLIGPDNGWHVPHADAEALAAVLRRALSDPDRLRAMGAASFAKAAEVNVDALVDAFVDAVARASCW